MFADQRMGPYRMVLDLGRVEILRLDFGRILFPWLGGDRIPVGINPP